MNKLAEKLVYWLFFGFGMAILPILIGCWFLLSRQNHPGLYDSLCDSVSKGELLIVCSALLGVNIGDLCRTPGTARYRLLRFSLIAASVFFALFTMAAYVVASTSTDQLSQDMIMETSKYMILFSACVCLISIFTD